MVFKIRAILIRLLVGKNTMVIINAKIRTGGFKGTGINCDNHEKGYIVTGNDIRPGYSVNLITSR